MPLTSRTANALVVASLAAVTWLSVAPAPAFALEPPRPLPRYHPAFVTETDERPWTDCLWASGAMLLDKWTNGEVTRTHQQLRTLAEDHRGGSTLADLRVAYARLGIDLQFSPDGGARITWPDLLRRLERGAGAVILGDDSDLPRWYGRWDVAFWKGTGDKDNHAVYVERYDRKRGRVWLMDPLGRAGWEGEWISVRALRRFAWSQGGALFVAVTPTAKAAPFQGVSVGSPSLSTTGVALESAWEITAPRAWRFPGADARATFEPASDPLRAAAMSPPVVAATAAAVQPPAKTSAGVAGTALRATAQLPDLPGAYHASLTVTDRRFGRIVAQVGGVAVFVPGPRRASLHVHVRDEAVEAGLPVPVSLRVANTGTETWAKHIQPPGAAPVLNLVRETRVVARWIRLDEPAEPAEAAPPPESPLSAPPLEELRLAPLAPGKRTTILATLRAPDVPGTWALVVDVVDDVDGSFAALGSAPAVQVFTIVAPRGVAEVE